MVLLTSAHLQILTIFSTATASGPKSYMSKLSSLFILNLPSLNLATPSRFFSLVKIPPQSMKLSLPLIPSSEDFSLT
jgi:hypothetical protein